MSQTTPSASPPRFVIQPAHCCAFSATTSTHTTLAPSSASPPAMPPPMLGLVPVTIATWPESFMGASLAPGAVRARQCITPPPVTLIDWPVMYSAASPARKVATSATSLGRAMRPSGVAAAVCLIRSSRCF